MKSHPKEDCDLSDSSKPPIADDGAKIKSEGMA